jgi:hypothetical protein
VPDAHHPISHHGGNQALIAKVAKINAYHVAMFAEYLQMLQETPEGEGTLLDHVTLMYGSSMGDGGKHEPRNLPILVAGGGGGTLPKGQHIQYASEEPVTNLYVTLLQKLGVKAEQFGDSTGVLTGI